MSPRGARTLLGRLMELLFEFLVCDESISPFPNSCQFFLSEPVTEPVRFHTSVFQHRCMKCIADGKVTPVWFIGRKQDSNREHSTALSKQISTLVSNPTRLTNSLHRLKVFYKKNSPFFTPSALITVIKVSSIERERERGRGKERIQQVWPSFFTRFFAIWPNGSTHSSYGLACGRRGPTAVC